MSKKLGEIRGQNAVFEKKSPYNFCDRWCERCVYEKQMRCTLYKEDFERKITCIAHGKNEDDPEITKAVMEAQYKEIDEKLSEQMAKCDIDLDDPDIDEDSMDEESAVDFADLPPEIQKHIRFVENNHLDITVKKYCDKAHDFLKKTFYKDERAYPAIKYDFETVSWYHTLLPVKLHRALCGFHEPATEGDISLCDAVAQFDICKNAIRESIRALRNINDNPPVYSSQLKNLIILLHNIDSRITIMLDKL